MQNALAKLGFRIEEFADNDEVPQGTVIQLDPKETSFKWNKLLEIDMNKPKAHFFHIDIKRNLHESAREERKLNQYSWFFSITRRFKSTFSTVFIYGVLIQVAALALPFFLMN